jgi:hypothetical protein
LISLGVVPHPVGSAVDGNDFGVMGQAIEH